MSPGDADARSSGNEDTLEATSRHRAPIDGEHHGKRRNRSRSGDDEDRDPWPFHAEHRYQNTQTPYRPPNDNASSSNHHHHHRHHHHPDQRPAPSPLTTSDGTSGSSREQQEDSLTVRRREANRLAAQRFRSRKKGYQDSLEEKVRQLEEDKELLVRRLTDMPGMPSLGRRTSASRHIDERPDVKPSSRLELSNLSQPASPEHREVSTDPDIRMAALESANRRLQEELRAVNEENDRLREELIYWQRRERDHREGLWTEDMQRRDERRVLHSPKSLSELSSTSHSLNPIERRGPGILYTPITTFPATLTPSTSQPSLRSPTAAAHPPLPSPGFRLPPLRLPPFNAPGMFSERASPGGSQTHYLPRAAELDGLSSGLLPPPSRQSGLPGDERRRNE